MSAAAAVPDFAPYFHSRHAPYERDAALMRDIHALRFQVYCLECGFLPQDDYPDGLETDDCDPHSSHFATFNLRDELVGYVRLVGPDAQGAFPFQAHCAGLFEGMTLAPAAEAAEISRLMVRKDYRRRRGDLLAGATSEEDEHHESPERRNSQPQALLSMFKQMYAYSVEHGIRYWYAAMERSLARVLQRMGFTFEKLGPETDYYGPVAPYLADLRALEQSVSVACPALMQWMRQPAGLDPTAGPLPGPVPMPLPLPTSLLPSAGSGAANGSAPPPAESL